MASAMNKLIQINLDLIDIAIEDGLGFEPRLGLGNLTFVTYARKGIEEALKLKESLASYKLRYEGEAEENKELHDIIERVFGDREIDSLPEDVLADILAYSKKRIEEVDKKWTD